MATYSSIKCITFNNPTENNMPCYLRPFSSNFNDKEDKKIYGLTNCCGLYQNISIFNNSSSHCSQQNFNLYKI